MRTRRSAPDSASHLRNLNQSFFLQCDHQRDQVAFRSGRGHIELTDYGVAHRIELAMLFHQAPHPRAYFVQSKIDARIEVEEDGFPVQLAEHGGVGNDDAARDRDHLRASLPCNSGDCCAVLAHQPFSLVDGTKSVTIELSARQTTIVFSDR